MSVTRLLLSAAAGLGLTVALPASAEAKDADGFGVFLGALLPANISFLIYDIGVAGKGEHPAYWWAFSETLTSVPSAIALNVVDGYVQARWPDAITWPYVLLTGMISGLSVHGPLSLAHADLQPGEAPLLRPGELLGVSMAAGFNTTLTTTVLTRAFSRRLSNRWLGVATMAVTAPQVATFAYGAVVDEERRPAWIAFSSWSGALFLHGLVSAIAGYPEGRERPSPRWTNGSLPSEPRAISIPRIDIGLAPGHRGGRAPPLLVSMSGQF